MFDNGWLWGFLGLLAVGFIVLNLKTITKRGRLKLRKRGGPLNLANQIQDWERRFAWKPIKTDDEGRIWLKHYWRRPVYLPTETDHNGVTTWPWYYQNVVNVEWHLW
jgi:hypothetical protein